MRKNLILISCLVVLPSCKFIDMHTDVTPEQCAAYVTKLESSKDIIDVLNTYINYRDGAAKYERSLYEEKKVKEASIERWCWRYYLKRQDIKYECLSQKDTSDECVLYRREHGIKYECLDLSNYDKCESFYNSEFVSKIDFFDYKRFLPDNTKITTESDFKMVLDYYEEVSKQCKESNDLTEEEKSMCLGAVEVHIRNFANNGYVSCKQDFNKTYNAVLTKLGNWYKWAIDHNPYEQYPEYAHLMTGEYGDFLKMSLYQPVYTKAEAKEYIENTLKEFGNKRLCSTDEYLKDLKKLGFKNIGK